MLKNLAREVAENPVSGPRGVAEERKCEDEQLVGKRQIPDVIVTN